MTTDSDKIRQRYDRIAPFFDGLEGMMEGLFFISRRRILWSAVDGSDILEVGVGTGKNFPFYPQRAHITGVDFSPKMLAQAQRKRDMRQIAVDLALMDVESLSYANNSFDTVIGTFVFCSVPKPRKGLLELYRVCKPGGQVLLLEHVLSSNRILAGLMNLMNPVIRAGIGANINRHTVKNVQACPFKKVLLEPSSSDLLKLIRAIK